MTFMTVYHYANYVNYSFSINKSVLIVNILLILSGKLKMVSDFNIDLTCNFRLLLGGEARPP